MLLHCSVELKKDRHCSAEYEADGQGCPDMFGLKYKGLTACAGSPGAVVGGSPSSESLP